MRNDRAINQGSLLDMMPGFTIAAEDPDSRDAGYLIGALSGTLAAITGDSGKSSFDPADIRRPHALFVVARDQAGRAVGCGAYRPLEVAAVAEIKRMYAVPNTLGIGAAILRHLELHAVSGGYRVARLSTRHVNTRAVTFYQRHGYVRIPNYGKYAGRDASVCFEKIFSSNGKMR